MNMAVPEPLLTEREAAKMMAISASQLAKMRYRGEIQAVHWGYRCIRYTIEEIRTRSHGPQNPIAKSRGRGGVLTGGRTDAILNTVVAPA